MGRRPPPCPAPASSRGAEPGSNHAREAGGARDRAPARTGTTQKREAAAGQSRRRAVLVRCHRPKKRPHSIGCRCPRSSPRTPQAPKPGSKNPRHSTSRRAAAAGEQRSALAAVKANGPENLLPPPISFPSVNPRRQPDPDERRARERPSHPSASRRHRANGARRKAPSPGASRNETAAAARLMAVPGEPGYVPRRERLHSA